MMRYDERRCRYLYRGLKVQIRKLGIFVIEENDDWIGYAEILPKKFHRVIMINGMRHEPWSQQLMVLAHEFCHHARYVGRRWVLRARLSSERMAIRGEREIMMQGVEI